MSRRGALLVLAVVVATVLPACGGSNSASGGGAHVDVCGAYEAYDALPEPDPRDRAAVQRWATAFNRVLARTETEDQVSDGHGPRHDVPAPVAGAILHLRTAIRRYQGGLRDATGAAAVAAADRLALDDEFQRADATLREFHDKTCR